jgi:hypothetical protein
MNRPKPVPVTQIGGFAPRIDPLIKLHVSLCCIASQAVTAVPISWSSNLDPASPAYSANAVGGTQVVPGTGSASARGRTLARTSITIAM